MSQQAGRQVEGAVKLGPAAFETLIGPGFLDHFGELTADDLPTNIEGVRAFLRACVAKPISAEDFETALCWNMVVPARVRGALGAREIDEDDVLRSLTVPLLVTQGGADTVVLPAMAEHILKTCPAAEASWYDGAGHAPFLEEPGRFSRELAELAGRVQRPPAAPGDRRLVR
jgi:non-heme chloroperoxidase